MPDQPTPKPTPVRRAARPSTATAKAGPAASAKPAKPRAAAAPAATAKPARASAAPPPAATSAAAAVRRASTNAGGNGHSSGAAGTGSVAILARDGTAVMAEPSARPVDELELTRGVVGRVEATDVVVNQGAIGAARAERVSVQMGALGFALTDNVTVSQGMARTVVAREAHLEQSAVQTVIAQQVHMERGSNAFIVIAQRVDGEVRALLDWRGAIALGVAIGAVLAVFRRGGRSRRRG